MVAGLVDSHEKPAIGEYEVFQCNMVMLRGKLSLCQKCNEVMRVWA